VGPNWSLTLYLLLAVLAANLPFVNQRALGVAVTLRAGKPVWWRLLELVVLYVLVGGAGLWLEHRVGQIASQRWEFYAITATLFVTFAFPGFVFRYLLKRPGGHSTP
jgi:hypothetical protein